MAIPNYGDKYDSPALFSATDAIEGQGGDSEAEIPNAIIITYQRDFFEKYENVQPKLLDPAIAALHDHLGVESMGRD